MLTEIAIADAYGAGFEFASKQFNKANNSVNRYFPHNLDDVAAGRYTDDTQQSLAIAELLLSGQIGDSKAIYQKLLEVYKRDPRPTYSKGFLNILQHSDKVEDFILSLKKDSPNNGAAMRSVPLGYISDVEKVVTIAQKQAELTHNSVEGVKASICVALMSHYFIYQVGSKDKLRKFLQIFVDDEFLPWSKPVRVKAMDAVYASVELLSTCNSLRDVLQKAVALGGDTDTTAAIAVGIASNSLDMAKDLPKFLFENLEDGEYGKKYLMEIDQALAAANPIQRS